MASPGRPGEALAGPSCGRTCRQPGDRHVDEGTSQVDNLWTPDPNLWTKHIGVTTTSRGGTLGPAEMFRKPQRGASRNLAPREADQGTCNSMPGRSCPASVSRLRRMSRSTSACGSTPGATRVAMSHSVSPDWTTTTCAATRGADASGADRRASHTSPPASRATARARTTTPRWVSRTGTRSGAGGCNTVTDPDRPGTDAGVGSGIGTGIGTAAGIDAGAAAEAKPRAPPRAAPRDPERVPGYIRSGTETGGAKS